MYAIAVANQKGGVGKTTLATTLAVCFANEGLSTLLIDADPQASALGFRARRAEEGVEPDVSCVQILDSTIHLEVPRLRFDRIVIDTGARDSKVFRSALLAADLVVVPMCPGYYDLWSSFHTFEVLSEIKLNRPAQKVLPMFNLVIPNTRIAADAMAAKADVEAQFQLCFMKAHLCSRVAHKGVVATGRTVFELSNRDRDPKAIDEFNAFYNELKEALLS